MSKYTNRWTKTRYPNTTSLPSGYWRKNLTAVRVVASSSLRQKRPPLCLSPICSGALPLARGVAPVPCSRFDCSSDALVVCQFLIRLPHVLHRHHQVAVHQVHRPVSPHSPAAASHYLPSCRGGAPLKQLHGARGDGTCGCCLHPPSGRPTPVPMPSAGRRAQRPPSPAATASGTAAPSPASRPACSNATR